MLDNFTFEWIFISWIITLFIHHHSIKRSVISNDKDNLIDLLSSLSELKWVDDCNSPLYLEERYNTKVARITWKLKQLNKITSCSLVEEKKLAPLYSFDIETYISKATKDEEKELLKFKLQEDCDDIVDCLEKTYFNKIATSKVFILWSARYTALGVLVGLTIIYLFFQIMLFLYS